MKRRIAGLLLILLLLLLPLRTFAEPVPEAPAAAEELPVREGLPLAGRRIGINPGHQAKGDYRQERMAPWNKKKKARCTSGTQGKTTRVPEYRVNLQIGLKLRDTLEALGAEVYMTRETSNVKLSNRERVRAMHEAGVDLALTLHCNGSKNRKKHGVCAYVPKRGDYSEASCLLGRLLLDEICLVTGAKRNKLSRSTSYTTLNWAETPAVLLEMGYMSNKKEDQLLVTDEYQQLLADGIANACIRYFAQQEASPGAEELPEQ